MKLVRKEAILSAYLLAGILTLTGCGETQSVNVNVESNSTISGNKFGKSTMVEIGDYLYYDATTRIVYWWNGRLNYCDYATTPTPYYAPSGLPYRYNPENNTFEEIDLHYTATTDRGEQTNDF